MPKTRETRQWTTDKKVFEALREAEKVRLLCYFTSNTNDVKIDWEAAADRWGGKASSFSVHITQYLKKIRAGTGPAAGSSGGAVSSAKSKKRAVNESEGTLPPKKRGRPPKARKDSVQPDEAAEDVETMESTVKEEQPGSAGNLLGIEDYDHDDLGF